MPEFEEGFRGEGWMFCSHERGRAAELGVELDRSVDRVDGTRRM